MTLEVMGHRFKVDSDADPVRAQEVATLLNQRIEEIRTRTRRAQDDQVALMAALNLAEELVEERARSERLRQRVRERSTRLLASIDAVSRQLERPNENAQPEAGSVDDSSRSLPGS